MSPHASVSALRCPLQHWASRAQPQAARLTRQSQRARPSTACGLCLSGCRERQRRGRADFRRLPVPRLVTAAAANVGVCPHGAMSWHGLARPSHLRGLGGVVLETEVLVCGPSTGPRSSVKVGDRQPAQHRGRGGRGLQLPALRSPALVHSVHRQKGLQLVLRGPGVQPWPEWGRGGPGGEGDGVKGRSAGPWPGREKGPVPCPESLVSPSLGTAVLPAGVQTGRSSGSGRTRRVRA